jgi:hypothetical protein
VGATAALRIGNACSARSVSVARPENRSLLPARRVAPTRQHRGSPHHQDVGVVERGEPGQPFNHTTGAGHVEAATGCYDDCINVKRNTFLLLISEIFGGVGGQAVRFLTRLSHTAREKSDTVYYDHAGREVVPFYLYHSRAVSRAAAVGHGEVLRVVVADARARATRAADDERRRRIGGGGGDALSPASPASPPTPRVLPLAAPPPPSLRRPLS